MPKEERREVTREVTEEDVKKALDLLGIRHGKFIDEYYVETKYLCRALGLFIDAGYQEIKDIVDRLNETE